MSLSCATVALLLICVVTEAKEKDRYSNSWAVEVRGGAEKAEELARKYGFVNFGQVSRSEMLCVHVSMIDTISIVIYNVIRL